MRIVASEDERNLWKMVKPYLKPEGLALVSVSYTHLTLPTN